MGYESYVVGSLKVVPPMPDQLVRDLYLAEDQRDNGNDLVATRCGEEDTVGIVNGTIAVIPGKAYTMIEVRWEEPFKAYELTNNFTVLADALKRSGGYEVIGALYVAGEDAMDRSRLRIDQNGDPQDEEPRLVWPNGDEGWGT